MALDLLEEISVKLFLIFVAIFVVPYIPSVNLIMGPVTLIMFGIAY